MKVRASSNMNSEEFPLLTRYTVHNTCSPKQSGKWPRVPCTEVSKGAPDFFKLSNVAVRNNTDVFLTSKQNFSYTDTCNRQRVVDMNMLKPSQSLDLFNFKRHDVKIKAAYFDAYQKHLDRRGFKRTSGAFTQLANTAKTLRVDESARANQFNMTKRYVHIADVNRRTF